MRIVVILNIILFGLSCAVAAQSKAELEAQRKQAMEEITYVDNMLKTTEKEKRESVQAIRIIGNKVNLRESVIKGMNDEISLLNDRIEINRLALDMMENDLKVLKKDYSKSILNSACASLLAFKTLS